MWNKRLEFQENNYYHIYNRWFEKQIIFKSDYDFERFYKEKFISYYSNPEYFKDKKFCQIKTVDFSNPEDIKNLKLDAGMYFVSFIGEHSKFSD